MKKKILFTALQLLTTTTALFAAYHPWHYEKRVINDGAAVEQTAYMLVDKGWRPHVKPGRHWHGEFVPFNEHFEKWVIVTTNAIEHVATVPAHSIYRDNITNLTAKVEELEPDAKECRKVKKAAEKAAKKDAKNYEKWLKDTQKARDKSSGDMAEFYDSIIEIATGTVPNK